MAMTYFLIFFGAGLGGVLRFLLSTTLPTAVTGWIFPIGTFCVNMTGCLLIGFLAQLMELKSIPQNEFRAFFLIGLLGGYSTFSSFGYETLQLVKSGEYLYASMNAVLQLALGLFFVWLGSILARLL